MKDQVIDRVLMYLLFGCSIVLIWVYWREIFQIPLGYNFLK